MEFVPARNKLEVVARISNLTNSGPETLGPGSKEHKSVVLNLARGMGLALAMGYQEWEFLIKVEKEMAEMFIVRGRVHEANEIFRRIKSVEDIVRSETVCEAA